MADYSFTQEKGLYDPMSVEASTRVWKWSKQKSGNLLVLLAIADQYNDEKNCAWPSVAFLAKKARMNQRNVRYCLKDLVQAGELIIEEAAGPHGVNIYRLPPLQTLQSATDCKEGLQ